MMIRSEKAWMIDWESCGENLQENWNGEGVRERREKREVEYGNEGRERKERKWASNFGGGGLRIDAMVVSWCSSEYFAAPVKESYRWTVSRWYYVLAISLVSL